MLKIWQSFLWKSGGDLPEKTFGYGAVKLIPPCTNSYVHVQKWNASWTVLTHTSMLEWHKCLQSKLCQSHRHFWWNCITVTCGGFVQTSAHTGKPHSCLVWGKPVHTPTHCVVPGSWLDWKENTGTYQCKTHLVKLIFFFYWPPKNKVATWANKHVF